ncbi:hypothetical protein C8F04DRAFT_1272585 [Mycena alexandri]|uniref:Uncharacterized protein n=1 Tax=Mycena alexandri TaxID=1745969 RepID=A0AAD6WRL9_9AGAR|nr:hypothetical protein C8F04DRAFT_1272585 [Mycena alexandri]
MQSTQVMPSELPPNGRLTGHYCFQNRLYTVSYGTHQTVLKTPTYEEAPPVDVAKVVPNFSEPRYLSLRYPYMAFVPKFFPWRDELFKPLDYSFPNLPIEEDDEIPGRFRLRSDVAEHWLSLESSLRLVGHKLMHMSESFKYPRLGWLASPWLFADRFTFLRTFPTEALARSAAWRCKLNFLPLLAYVSMAFWIAEGYDLICAVEEPRVDWRAELLAGEFAAKPAFLDLLSATVVRNWTAERVGCLYQIGGPPGSESSEQRAGRNEVESLLSDIILAGCPFPLYISWGSLPATIYPGSVSEDLQRFIPSQDNLDSFHTPQGKMCFKQYAVSSHIDPESGEEFCQWREYPHKREPSDIDTAPPPVAHRSSPVPVNPFPPLPKHSAQRKNETIYEFFTRRGESNRTRIAKENAAERQQRTQRQENAKKSGRPSKTACVYYWDDQGGHYIRNRVNRAEFDDLWDDYPRPQRRFDPVHNEWDLCVLFEQNEPVFGVNYDNRRDDEDEDDDDDMDQHPIFPANADMATFLPSHATNTVEVRLPEDVEMEPEQSVFEGEELG